MRKVKKKINYNDIHYFVKKILLKVGLNKHSAESVTLGLCETSLRGVDSHGIRLLPHYVKSVIKGRKNPKPNFKLYKPYPSLEYRCYDALVISSLKQ